MTIYLHSVHLTWVAITSQHISNGEGFYKKGRIRAGPGYGDCQASGKMNENDVQHVKGTMKWFFLVNESIGLILLIQTFYPSALSV